MRRFLQRHADKITGVLSGLDRVRFGGIFRWLSSADGLSIFLDRIGVRYKDFAKFAHAKTRRLRDAFEAMGQRVGRPVEYLNSSAISKEAWVDRKVAREGSGKDGVLALLSCVEPCMSFEVGPNANTKMLEIRYRLRKCLHHYVYFDDPALGRVQVRYQTWFPFRVNIVLNGRDWLTRQLDAHQVGYLRRDNSLVACDDFAAAQELLKRQMRTAWAKTLDRLLERACPLLTRQFDDLPLYPYWIVQESEWATDLIFADPEELKRLYPKLILHGMARFGCGDVLRFLGQKVASHGGPHGRFAGEIVSDLKRRPEGIRLKHRLGSNSVKMYDKFGQILRVETTIVDARDLKAYRPKESDPKGPLCWQRMRKGVADFHRRCQLSHAANQRYLDSLAAVDDPRPLGELTDKLCRRTTYQGRSVRALNPFNPDDARLLKAIGRGEFRIKGFRNAEIRQTLFGDPPQDPAERKRQSGKVTRLLRLLRAHQLIAKVQGANRYQLTALGTVAVAAIDAARQANTEQLTRAA